MPSHAAGATAHGPANPHLRPEDTIVRKVEGRFLNAARRHRK